MKDCNALAFLDLLGLLNFDEDLFRKEFRKTLKWIPVHKHYYVSEWMKDNHYNDKYPDLMEMLL